jgi:hypothetical protein
MIKENLKANAHYIVCKERNTLRCKYKYIFLKCKYIGKKFHIDCWSVRL